MRYVSRRGHPGIDPHTKRLKGCMFAFLILIMPVILTACGGSGGEQGGGKTPRKSAVVGTYVQQGKTSDYLELRRDGTYYLVRVLPGLPIPQFGAPPIPGKPTRLEKTGEWSIEDDGRVVCLEGTLLCLKIRANLLADPVDGTVWVKQR